MVNKATPEHQIVVTFNNLLNYILQYSPKLKQKSITDYPLNQGSVT